MIKTVTRPTNSLHIEPVNESELTEDLGEEELSFYSSIKKDLNNIELVPNQASVNKILNYSRSM